MPLRFLKERFHDAGDREAMVWQGQSCSYRWLAEAIDRCSKRLEQSEVRAGTVTSLLADFSPNSVAMLLALAQRGAIIVPMTRSVVNKKQAYERISQCEIEIEVSSHEEISIHQTQNIAPAHHELYTRLRQSRHPGLVLFSSGSSGQPKATVHDFALLLEKFRLPRRPARTLAFLLYDHIGGLNTLLHTLSSGGCIVVTPNRSVESVLAAIQDFAVELLPTSPTFLKLLLISAAYHDYDLRSLKMITYGTEPMPQSILATLHQILPHVTFKQTYGLSEVGILRSKSKDSSSLWMQLGGDDTQTRVVDDVLQIKSRSAMLGYLNAPSPFTTDGWFVTGDAVQVDGEFIKVLGRGGEIINVGGEKVYPAEVEEVIEAMPEIQSATAYGETNAIMGMIVCVRVKLSPPNVVPERELTRKVREHCRNHLSPKQIPVRVSIDTEPSHDERFKKRRLPPQ
ncbi:Long-chain-fatty-acid--CoA ligase [Novipirellula galeiformis]|uniref:Long-chain-fatty-acid--CoA ligase n=1 Tax=Novipirellula galeiformis TaxID=2528004 RepID=A0A5C6CUQ6_9BACT|nr:fatty acid--CoA ligase family protein [Novipirellula galeiformis]TWU26786.1 Long-chain-fatty-acid--CoA ligase [Novipirellula galeiformis]